LNDARPEAGEASGCCRRTRVILPHTISRVQAGPPPGGTYTRHARARERRKKGKLLGGWTTTSRPWVLASIHPITKRTETIYVYENTRALPRALVVHEYVCGQDFRQAIDWILTRKFSARTTAVCERAGGVSPSRIQVRADRGVDGGAQVSIRRP
jgi:hypothetical protein